MKLKESGQETQVILQVHGREKVISEKELISILEKHFPEEISEKVTTETFMQAPKENEWFDVNPLGISKELFQEKRKDEKQEKTRQLILEAFEKMEKNPQMYGRKFKTMIPEKTWQSKTIIDLHKMSSSIGDRMADWVEQALEWAQRISNGETWEALCNARDTANYYRAILYKDQAVHIVGGSLLQNGYEAASFINGYGFYESYVLYSTVPLVVLYER